MAYVTYLATIGFVSYHLENVSYDFNFEISDIKHPSGDAIRTTQESLSGKVETNWYGERAVWELTTRPYQRNSADGQLLREFLRSTADGQRFTLDPYGFVGNDGEPMTVIREDEGHSESVFKPLSGYDDYVQYGFKVREV